MAGELAEGVNRYRCLTAETARIVILEQPAKVCRFRFEAENRIGGSLVGVRSTLEKKTLPTIQVVGYEGRAVVIVSCVTLDAPYRPHPNKLVGRKCSKGVLQQHVNVSSNNMDLSFPDIWGIQRTLKRGVEAALKEREEIGVDPFLTGFAHRSEAIDIDVVRLCYQVFLEGPEPNTYTRALKPVVTEPVHDKRTFRPDLVICDLSDSSSSVEGGKKIVLLCEKIAKDDIRIRFYEERENQVVWEAYADFQPSQVHKKVAVSFLTPRYERLDVNSPVNVFIQLQRPSDGATSEPMPFKLCPVPVV